MIAAACVQEEIVNDEGMPNNTKASFHKAAATAEE